MKPLDNDIVSPQEAQVVTFNQLNVFLFFIILNFLSFSMEPAIGFLEDEEYTDDYDESKLPCSGLEYLRRVQ